MLDTEGTKEYWRVQTEKGDNPCHYHNYWQDRYAYEVRTGAFRSRDFRDISKVVDVGCGIGEYTERLARLAPRTKFVGYDFPFNIALGKEKQWNVPNLTLCEGSLPEPHVVVAIEGADAALTTTVYVHLSTEAREAFITAVAGMRMGAKVMLLEYFPAEVPSFQRNLPYKKVETPAEVVVRFKRAGFLLSEERAVNYLDSFLFHHLGTNAVSYYLTRMCESVMRILRWPRSKYKLLIFTKTASHVDHSISQA